ncbi:MAG: LuxR family transcriptional regulator [Rhizobiaceae bacterium]|jgi:LuxR family quorum sensing-dependent transcriptional regulator
MGLSDAMTQFDKTLEYINKIQDAHTPEEVCRALVDVTSEFGLTALLAGTVPTTGTPGEEQRGHVLLCDWPMDWLERYVTRNYVDHDPLVQYMRKSPSYVKWSDAAAAIDLDRNAREVYCDAGAYKLNDGYALPLVTLEGDIVMVSLGGERVDLDDHAVRLISLASTYAIGRAIQLGSETPMIDHRPELTPREKECMRWAAAGKSEWEISQILGISEHTSEKHLLNAKAKLGAANRVQAIAEAIRHGYIS